MYLIRAELNSFDSQTRAALSDCQLMHKLVTGMFNTDRLSSSVLYRLNMIQGKCMLYIYASRPVVGQKIEKYRIVQKDISGTIAKLQEGQNLSFDLLASPSKDISDGGKNSKRRLLRDPQERLAWLERKAVQNGFSIVHATELESVQMTGKHSADNGGTMHLSGVHFQGVLTITDSIRFQAALEKGIGSGKAYGFGMLLIKNT